MDNNGPYRETRGLYNYASACPIFKSVVLKKNVLWLSTFGGFTIGAYIYYIYIYK